jgi:hypothetical protein
MTGHVRRECTKRSLAFAKADLLLRCTEQLSLSPAAYWTDKSDVVPGAEALAAYPAQPVVPGSGTFP